VYLLEGVERLEFLGRVAGDALGGGVGVEDLAPRSLMVTISGTWSRGACPGDSPDLPVMPNPLRLAGAASASPVGSLPRPPEIGCLPFPYYSVPRQRAPTSLVLLDLAMPVMGARVVFSLVCVNLAVKPAAT
jgi:hypothetical protein